MEVPSPLPGLSAQILPLWLATILWQMASPSPWRFRSWRAGSALKNSSKISVVCSGSSPTPSSRTETRTASGRSRASRTTVPFWAA